MTIADPYVTDEIFDQLPPLPYFSAQYSVRGAGGARLLDDGEVVDLGR